jgi:hypothetical protein
MADYTAYDKGEPCRNPHCSSHGKPHPNCQCYADGGCVGQHDEACEYYARGGQVADNHNLNDASFGIEHAAAQNGLLDMLGKPNPQERMERHFRTAKKGHSRLREHAGRFFEKHSASERMEKPDTQGLKDRLVELEANPGDMLSLGDGMDPAHAAQMGATAANAVNYLGSLRPKRMQNAPLDRVPAPDKDASERYDRQLRLAQNPLMAMQHAKNGTIQPHDMDTLRIVYPKLTRHMQDALHSALVDARTSGKSLSYAQKQGLSTFLGQPLDSTMAQPNMQAIIASQGKQQASQQMKNGQPKKATGPELKQINEVDKLYQTPQEARLANRKE